MTMTVARPGYYDYLFLLKAKKGYEKLIAEYKEANLELQKRVAPAADAAADADTSAALLNCR